MTILPGGIIPKEEKEDEVAQSVTVTITPSIWTVNTDIPLGFTSDRIKLNSAAVTISPDLRPVKADLKPIVSSDHDERKADKEQKYGKRSAPNNIKAERKR